MLTVRKISSLDATEYGRYLAGQDRRLDAVEAGTSLARSDYYLGESAARVDGEQQVGGAAWFGAEADRLAWGMTGEIDADKLARLMSGQHAHDLEADPVRVGGYSIDPSALRAAIEDGIAARGGLDSLDSETRTAALAALEGELVDADGNRYGGAINAYSRGNDQLIKRLAEPLEQAGLLGTTINQSDTVSQLRAALRRADEMALSDDDQAVARRALGILADDQRRLRNLPEKVLRAEVEILADRGIVDPIEAPRKLSDFRVQVVNSQDLTFSAPKSVSLAWAAAGPRERALIEEAVVASSQRTMEYLAASTGVVKVKRGGRVEYEGATGAVGATFLHHSARGVSDLRPDPQLHVHTLLLGVKRRDGKMVTPDQAELVRHGREGGAYFRCELASQLRQLGLAIETGTGKDARYFELAGFDEKTLRRFSNRAEGIEAWERQFREDNLRPPTIREREAYIIKSRRIKQVDTAHELDREWRRELAPLGHDRVSVQYMFSQRNHPSRDDKQAVQQQVEAAILDRMEGSASMVRDREVRSIALECSAGRLSNAEALELVGSMQARGRIVALSDGYVTTARLRTTEAMIVASVERQITTKAITSATIEKSIAAIEREKGWPLSSEQRRAIEVGCSNVAVSAIVGVAGSGKGVAITAVSDATRRSGNGIVTVSTQGIRAQGAGKQAQANGLSVEMLVARHERGTLLVTEGKTGSQRDRVGLKPGDVILVDEAGMVDTHRFAALIRVAEDTGARLVLVGDPQQLAPVGAGGMFEQIIERVPKAELVEVHRTKIEYLRDAALAIRDGRAEDAVQLMRDNGKIHLANTNQQAMERMVKDWSQWRHEAGTENTLLIVHTSNEHVDRVNELAQVERMKAGELSGPSVAAPDRPYSLYAGEPVIFRQSAYHVEGDRRVENGTRGIIQSVDAQRQRVTVLVDEPKGKRSVEVDLRNMDRSSLRLMYASHVMPSQGETIAQTAELTGQWGTNKKASYVGASRLEFDHRMYTSRQALDVPSGSDEDRYRLLAERMNEITDQGATLTREVDAKRRIGRQAATSAYDRAVERYDAARDAVAPAKDRARLLEQVVKGALEDPPSVIRHALGARPSDPELRRTWDEGAAAIATIRAQQRFHDPRQPLPSNVYSSAVERKALGDAKATVARAQIELQRATPGLVLTHQVTSQRAQTHTRER